MRKQRKSAASRAGEALAALRMTKMTPEERSRVARLGGYAKAAAARKANAAARRANLVEAIATQGAIERVGTNPKAPFVKEEEGEEVRA